MLLVATVSTFLNSTPRRRGRRSGLEQAWSGGRQQAPVRCFPGPPPPRPPPATSTAAPTTKTRWRRWCQGEAGAAGNFPGWAPSTWTMQSAAVFRGGGVARRPEAPSGGNCRGLARPSVSGRGPDSIICLSIHDCYMQHGEPRVPNGSPGWR